MSDSAFTPLLIHTATLRRPETPVGDHKRPVTSTAALASGVACRVKPVRADSKQAIGGAIFDSDHKAYFLPGVDVRERDLVTVDSVTYVVQGVERPVDGAGVHHLTVHLKRQQ